MSWGGLAALGREGSGKLLETRLSDTQIVVRPFEDSEAGEREKDVFVWEMWEPM